VKRSVCRHLNVNSKPHISGCHSGVAESARFVGIWRCVSGRVVFHSEVSLHCLTLSKHRELLPHDTTAHPRRPKSSSVILSFHSTAIIFIFLNIPDGLDNNSLRAWRSRDRIRVGASFFTPAQTGRGAHPSSCTLRTGVFLGGKTAGAWRWPPTPSSLGVREEIKLCLYTPSGLYVLFENEFYLYLPDGLF
jgi:hypothetical protein